MGDGFYRSKDPTNSIKVLKGKLTEDECCSKQVDYVGPHFTSSTVRHFTSLVEDEYQKTSVQLKFTY